MMVKNLVKTLVLPILVIPMVIDYIDTNLSFGDILGDYFDNE